jgi:Endosomal/lysosomal potassium channel TMEM175
VLSVDLVASRRIWPAHVGGLVDLEGSRRVPSDRVDDQPDDQASQAAQPSRVEESPIFGTLVLHPQGMTERTVTKTRLEAFSDGVLAIAITLLVISTVKAGHLSLVTRPGDVTKVILSAIDATT